MMKKSRNPVLFFGVAAMCALMSVTSFAAAYPVSSALSLPVSGVQNAASISAAKAKEIAERQVPAQSTYLRTKEDGTNFEVKFYNKVTQTYYEVSVGRLTGEITVYETDALSKQGSLQAALGENGAKNVVLSEFPDAQITTVKLESDDGYLVYEVSFATNKYHGEYTLNAQTGKILERDIYLSPASGAASTQQLLTYTQLEALTAKQIPNSVMTEIELERKNGIYVYQVTAVSGQYEYELDFRATDGELLQTKRERSYGLPAASVSSFIGMEKAAQIALAKTPGDVKKCELDIKRNNRSVYKVEIRQGDWSYEYEIDASSGAILETEMEFDD